MVKHARSMLGSVDGTKPGCTLPHERLMLDGFCTLSEPSAASDRRMASASLGWDTIRWLRYHRYENRENVSLRHECEAPGELAARTLSTGELRQLAVENPRRLLCLSS